MRFLTGVSILFIGACAAAQAPAEKFASYYEPVPAVNIRPSIPATPLPLDLTQAGNWEQAQGRLSEPARALMAKNGFVITDAFANDRVEEFYKSVKEAGLPIFITSDSLLHLYHIQFDETLKGIEERQFVEQLKAFSAAMSRAFQSATVANKSRPPRDAAALSLCRNYFAVAEELLYGPRLTDPPIPQEVQAELALIEKHAGFARSQLFGYEEDYSQYVPRGHYTRSEELKRYFKAMMWYGRMAFLIKGNNETITDALVGEETAKVQTLAALRVAEMLSRVTCKTGTGGKEVKAQEIWDRIYSVTAFYVGFADDLTPAEYAEAWRNLPRAEILPASAHVESKEGWMELQAALAKIRPPEIYGGTGNRGAGPNATEADLIKALANTQGMRLMGQRFIPDSYIMGRLVYPAVGKLNGNPAKSMPLPFTAVQSPAGIIRGFPRGLDVASVIAGRVVFPGGPTERRPQFPGIADRAEEILNKVDDSAYENYADRVKSLRAEFQVVKSAGIPPPAQMNTRGIVEAVARQLERQWNRNLYWGWLYALKGLDNENAQGYPAFMSTPAWADKQLNAFLGAWSQLRHDTILYAKQSYTMRATAGPMRPKMVEGYVEPVPELYRRLLGLARMTRKGLDDMKALDDPSRNRLSALEGIIERLYKITASELANEKLSADDYEFITFFGDQLKNAVAGVSSEGLETTIIADVHTDANSGKVLEEGTGPMRGMAVAYPMPDGSFVIGFGPVFSYYEFKQPMADRLTDEAWKAMLRHSAPQPPEWMKTIVAK